MSKLDFDLQKIKKLLSSIAQKYRNLFYPLILLIIVIIIAYINYKPNTWFTGWDNLHQEFNFKINWERHLTATWQEYQGLGLPAAMGHASDIPRLLLIYFFDLFLPSKLVRYSYMFFCLFCGSIGMYHLVNWLIKTSPKKLKKNFNQDQIDFISFVGTIFFIFNFGTISTFYSPISMFPTQWAFLPWLFLFFFKILNYNKPKDYFKYALASFFGAPMAYTPTLFVIYATAITIASLAELSVAVFQKELKEKLFRVFKIGLITIAINSFWLFPFFDFVLNRGGQTVQESTINSYISQELYARNRARSNFEDVTSLKGFYFDIVDYQSETDDYDLMMADWVTHLSQPTVNIMGYVFFAIISTGLIYITLKRHNHSIALLAIFIFTIFILLNSNPPTGMIFDRFRSLSPTFKEMMRMSFTKIVQLGSMIYSIAFTFGIIALWRSLEKITKANLLKLVGLTAIFSVFIYSQPVFSGNLLYPELKIKIPANYFKAFNWFADQPKQPRIANFPLHDFNNWYHYDWGYRGSGFIWYGLQQPVLDRSFDVWSNNNEQYFNEMHYAVYNKDFNEIKNIMTKYHIGWIFYDKSMKISATQSDTHNSFYNEQLIPELLNHKDFTLVEEFGDIMIIEYSSVTNTPSYLDTLSNMQDIGPLYHKKTLRDSGFGTYQDYRTTENPNIFYPVRDLKEFEENLEIRNKKYSYTKTYNTKTNLQIPNYWETENNLIVDIYAEPEGSQVKLEIHPLVPEIFINNEKIYPDKSYTQEIYLPKNNYFVTSKTDVLELFPQNFNKKTMLGSLSLTKDEEIKIYENQKEYIDLTSIIQKGWIQVKDCKDVSPSEYNPSSTVDIIKEGERIILKGKDSTACIIYRIPKKQSNDYLISLEFDYMSETGNYPRATIYSELKDSWVQPSLATPLQRAQTDFAKYENYFPISQNASKWNWLHLFLDTQDKSNEEQISFKNIHMNLNPIYKSVKLAKLQKINKKINSEEQTITVKLPKAANSYLSPNIELTDIFDNENNNCLNGVLYKTEKQYSRDYNVEDSSVEFFSQNASSCGIIWTGLHYPTDKDYLLTTKSSNKYGQPLEIIFAEINHPDRINRFVLPKKEDVVTNKIIPSQFPDNKGFKLEYNNSSRGSFPSKNIIHSIHIQYIPLDFIKNISLQKDSINITNKNSATSNHLEIKEIIHPAPHIYKAKVKGEGVLHLKQSYDSGWVLLGIDAKHFPINNWSNGWQINANNTVEITIIYLPQILQFTGGVLAFTTFMSLSAISFRSLTKGLLFKKEKFEKADN